MKELKDVLTGTAITTVDAENTAMKVGSGSLSVFATPMMIALMEKATCNAASPLLDEGETTVGTSVNITHNKASAVGEVITATAKLSEVDGRRLVFAVSARNEADEVIGSGKIERFVVLADKFMKKVEGSK